MARQSSRVPRTVWVLGFVSLFMDVSSELVHSLLPLFLVVGLGASPAVLGVIEGIAESTASVAKLFSGWLSDRLGRRKLLVALGYGLGAASKPLFPLATAPWMVLAARFADRVGKGVRGAPRDALVADVTPPGLRGAAYGVRQSLDTVGAFVGPLAAIGLMALLDGDIRAVLMLAVLPAVISVVLVVAGVEEPRAGAPRAAATPVRWSEAGALGVAFWGAVGVGVVFTLARFSEAFLILRGADLGFSATLAPLVLVAMNLVYAVAAAPLGGLSDRIGRRPLLAAGLVALVAADLVLALAPGPTAVLMGAGLWGLHMALTQGLLSAVVADAAPPRLRGAAFGMFNLATGVALLAASTLAGVLWAALGPAATFLAGAAFAAVAGVGLLGLRRRG
ncbi:multidrug-efflux transporter [Phenylobacterium zucineum HLK1]|uniref:Multidrug-efflux transporter n=1 Tax=Phenylobacterium zucineum (strain HLK1) TaxID=450851 RepID=B4R879_PHEZH|nr:MFS transporter [Phenylobacterium zucineum]ACG79197.1 multidrug-efflux transporter [Phenylobacterium zucineum HLK1]